MRHITVRPPHTIHSTFSFTTDYCQDYRNKRVQLSKSTADSKGESDVEALIKTKDDPTTSEDLRAALSSLIDLLQAEEAYDKEITLIKRYFYKDVEKLARAASDMDQLTILGQKRKVLTHYRRVEEFEKRVRMRPGIILLFLQLTGGIIAGVLFNIESFWTAIVGALYVFGFVGSGVIEASITGLALIAGVGDPDLVSYTPGHTGHLLN